MSIKFEKNQNKKNYSQIKVKQKLVINPQHTLLGLKRALPIIEEISFRGGTILLVGSNTKYRKLMQQYAFEVNQPGRYEIIVEAPVGSGLFQRGKTEILVKNSKGGWFKSNQYLIER